jgi:hypothetical protein
MPGMLPPRQSHNLRLTKGPIWELFQALYGAEHLKYNLYDLFIFH